MLFSHTPQCLKIVKCCCIAKQANAKHKINTNLANDFQAYLVTVTVKYPQRFTVAHVKIQIYDIILVTYVACSENT